MQLETLDYKEFENIFADIVEAKISKNDAKKILLEINKIGINSAMIIGAVNVLQRKMKKVSAPKNAIDVCGTGGDKLNTLNISTALCFVVAACGVAVAKHGNKAVSSKSGSADIFAELGVSVLQDVSQIEKNLREKNLCFLYAPFFHEALKNVAEIRAEIAAQYKVATIFNYLGPLLNPANVKRQLIGVSNHNAMLAMAEFLRLFSEKSYLVHGFDGMDEITLCDNSYLIEVDYDKKWRETIIDPKKFGLKKCDLQELRGGDAKYNALKLREFLDGKKSFYRDVVLLNSAFALKLAGVVDDVWLGFEKAAKAVDEGRAKMVLDSLVK
jgi:anthranilate phosphoribosyltransferase